MDFADPVESDLCEFFCNSLRPGGARSSSRWGILISSFWDDAQNNYPVLTVVVSGRNGGCENYEKLRKMRLNIT